MRAVRRRDHLSVVRRFQRALLSRRPVCFTADVCHERLSLLPKLHCKGGTDFRRAQDAGFSARVSAKRPPGLSSAPRVDLSSARWPLRLSLRRGFHGKGGLRHQGDPNTGASAEWVGAKGLHGP